MTSRPDFDELYSVSDLHLGGVPGFQIFSQGSTLAALIDHAAHRALQMKVAFVINGDIVDFLAEEPPEYLDQCRAVSKLKRVMEDPAFSMVWESLQRLMQSPKAYLILVIGNHDLELALPSVRSYLREYLCGDDLPARARLLFSMDGAGYRCSVGGTSVLCMHGNSMDPFNCVDHGALLETSAADNRGVPPPDWEPNGGTRLVIDVMNKLKPKYRWIDLLKPEVEAVVPVLLAADPSSVSLLPRALRAGLQAARDAARMWGLLSEEELGPEIPEEPELALLGTVGDTFPDLREGLQAIDGAQLLASVEMEFAQGRDGFDLLEGGDELLGGPLVWIRERIRKKKIHYLRRSLKKAVAKDDGFKPEIQDDLFGQVDPKVAADIDFVLTGHTHMHKLLRRNHGPGYYFNSGTWISLIQLRQEWLKDDAAFKPVFQAFEDGSLDALSKVPIGNKKPSLVMHRPSVVRLAREETGTVSGTLCETAIDKDGNAELEPVVEPVQMQGRGTP